MEWNVYIYDINARGVKVYNIFKHYNFLESCKKALKQYKDNKEHFIEQIRRELSYYFWSKCEWEILIDDFPSRPDYPAEKVDVYDQVRLNWNIFVDYIWENREKLRRAKC